MYVKYIESLLLLLGSVLIFYGLYQIYPPIAYVVLGGFLIFLSFPSKEGGKS